MADIVINGATYKDVPSIQVPDENGEMVEFEETNYISDLLEGSLTKLPNLKKTIKLRDYALAHADNITQLDLPNCKIFGDRACLEMTNLKFANTPNAQNFMYFTFYNCKNLEYVNCNNLISLGSYSLEYCTSLSQLEFSHITTIYNECMAGCYNLKAVIIRTAEVPTMNNSNAFLSSPQSQGTGYIYVPSDLVDSYKTATNWSVYANQFRALEDYTVDGTTTGELDESKI